ncbi:hypothetical protein RRG08_062807 [Elysia crispata]|uniref:Protein kinase domain-containing protein n=1 Tax=Elysia crispata TaxID=231223 RepID=A0AAE1DPA5_9GAST|nr:hypothetical protein RRG08_062807 [Elysia crispata]
MEKVKNILGKGNSAGEVYMVQDKGTGRDYALKTVLLIHFNKDEIRAWVHLADKGKAPELYSFHLEDNRVYIKMEILEGKTLKDIFVSEGFGQLMADKEKSEQKKCFSLLLLHGLLENFELLREGKFTHGDGHSGNIVVLPTLDVQLIDFGSAKGIRQGDGIDHTNKLKADVVNIIRQFCAAYSGVDFNEYCDALKALQEKNFQDIQKSMTNIPESDRNWLFRVMLLVFDTVRDNHQEGFADTSKAASEVQAMLPPRKDLEDMKKKIAVLLFPEKYKNPHHDPEFVLEAEVNDEGNTLLDDPDLADLSTLVDLKKDFGDLSLF